MNPADLRSYDRIIVAFSGGKDSLGRLLTLFEAGVPPGPFALPREICH